MRAVKEEPHGFAVDSFMKIFSCRSMYMLCVNSVHTVYSVYYTLMYSILYSDVQYTMPNILFIIFTLHVD